jgi:hypothetical protein
MVIRPRRRLPQAHDIVCHGSGKMCPGNPNVSRVHETVLHLLSRGVDRFSFLVPFFWDLQRGKREAARKFTPIINERRRLEREMGSEYKKPVQSRVARSL